MIAHIQKFYDEVKYCDAQFGFSQGTIIKEMVGKLKIKMSLFIYEYQSEWL